MYNPYEYWEQEELEVPIPHVEGVFGERRYFKRWYYLVLEYQYELNNMTTTTKQTQQLIIERNRLSRREFTKLHEKYHLGETSKPNPRSVLLLPVVAGVLW